MPPTPPNRPSGGNGDGGMGFRGSQGRLWLIFLIFALFLLALNYLHPRVTPARPAEHLSYSQLMSEVSKHQVATASINSASGDITGRLANGNSYVTNGPSPPIDSDITAMRNAGVVVTFVHPAPSLLQSLFPYLIYLGPSILVLYLLMRAVRGQMASVISVSKSRAKLYTSEKPRTTFADVAGYQGVKQEVAEVVEFLRNPGKFRAIGARIPRGILLVGPPGTGKTLLARAVAGEAGVPFLSVSGSDFMELFVGVGASRVRDLFNTARKQAPCIVFIDEIDSIGRKRGTGLGGGHDEREQTLNQLLSEMDGFDPAENVIMMAATNRPDILDPALLRPGRFDRQILVPLPDLPERVAILKVHCRDKRLGPDVDLELVARGTPGMSGADLSNLVNEAALHAVRRNSPVIEMQDFEAARDRVLMGLRRESLVLSPAEKERVAYHEAGHAVLAYVLPHADPLHKVTILPTGMALGVTQQLPLEEKHIQTQKELEDRLAVRMGGRAAELIVYGDLSTGAANDLQANTELARKMIREWGFSSRLGPMAWGSNGLVFLGEDLVHTRDYSEETTNIIDEEVAQLLKAQEDRAMQVLLEHRKGLEAVAKALLEKETISGEEVARLVDAAYGRPVHTGKAAAVPHFTQAAQPNSGPNGFKPSLPRQEPGGSLPPAPPPAAPY